MTGPPPTRFAVVAAETEAAKQALEELHDRYLCAPPEHANASRAAAVMAESMTD